jgi:hypothetical protein
LSLHLNQILEGIHALTVFISDVTRLFKHGLQLLAKPAINTIWSKLVLSLNFIYLVQEMRQATLLCLGDPKIAIKIPSLATKSYFFALNLRESGCKNSGRFIRGSDPLDGCLPSCGTIPPLWCG